MFSNFLGYFMVIPILVYLSIWRFWQKRKRGLPPGPRPLPLIGNLHQLGIRPYEAFMRIGKKYGPYFSVDYGSYPALILNDYKVIRKFLGEESFSGRPKAEVFKERTGGITRGILLTESTTWEEQHRFVIKNLGGFGFGKKSMESRIMTAAQSLITKFKAHNEAPIQTKFAFSSGILTSLWQIVTGEDVDEEDPEMVALLRMVTNGFANTLSTALCFFFPKLNKLAPSLTGYQAAMINAQLPIMEFIKSKIVQQKEMYNTDDKPGNLFEAYFAEMKKTTDTSSSFYGEEGEKQLAGVVLDFFIAGTETTSTTLNWVFLILALHPEIQSKVFDEISGIVKSGLPTLNDRTKMPYTECFMMEVNRFASVVPLAVFHSTTQDTELDGYKIPKDTWVTPNLYGVMHDPEVWGDPDVIRPERFLTPTGQVDRHHPAYIPFSVGRRRCIGEALARDDIFIFLTSFCQAFWIEPNPDEVLPTLAYHPGFTLSPKSHSLIFRIRK